MKEGSDDDVDALDELIDLLRASSETHSEDDTAWETFRKEITQRRVDYIKGEDLRKVSLSRSRRICPRQLIPTH